jgi:DNA/RNA endonuclease G (NUC1)
MPKRGFNRKRFADVYAEFNLYIIDKYFEDGDTVNMETLAAKGLIRKEFDGLSILGDGELGKKVTVPVGYFKAVLRYQKSSTIGYSGYMGCAFYMEHKNYSGSAGSKSMSMSISDLEKKLGYGLFVNLTDKVDAATAKKIKDENPSTVSWWW